MLSAVAQGFLYRRDPLADMSMECMWGILTAFTKNDERYQLDATISLLS